MLSPRFRPFPQTTRQQVVRCARHSRNEVSVPLPARDLGVPCAPSTSHCPWALTTRHMPRMSPATRYSSSSERASVHQTAFRPSSFEQNKLCDVVLNSLLDKSASGHGHNDVRTEFRWPSLDDTYTVPERDITKDLTSGADGPNITSLCNSKTFPPFRASELCSFSV